ncbi:MAG: tRNA 2-thiouridine(34) synthase MnmA [Patescibacteria group bacterium]
MVRKLGLKVCVGMSGGVDSSVAAVLLKKGGYEVVGVFIKIWIPELSNCDWRAERRDAMRAAAKIGIPLITLDLSAEYKKLVIDYLLREYRLGRTPNPDVMCNKEIKFGLFYREVMKRGADFIATGHYARKQLLGTSCQLLASKDKNKDQTYFLWTLTPEILSKTLFPIGDYKKSEVRKLAAKFGLPNAAKPDSQGLCFLGPVDFKDFLAQHLPEKVGQVLDGSGKVIGEHKGAHFYTIGERHGFTLSKQTPDEAPHYIVSKDMKNNTITIAVRIVNSKIDNSRGREIILKEVNWIGRAPKSSDKLMARCRYRAPLVPCHVKVEGDRVKIIFDQPQTTIASGQSCVLYDARGVACLGGGVIE